jgi:hypothetical protein
VKKAEEQVSCARKISRLKHRPLENKFLLITP